MAEGRVDKPLPAPVGPDRSALAFTEQEKFEVAEYARETTMVKAVEVFKLSWPTVKKWVDRYPAGSRPPVAVGAPA